MAKHIDWTKKSANFQIGCENGCLYCYAREMAAKYGWKDPSDWGNGRIREKELSRNFPNFGEPVMFPSSHDITPNNLESAIRFLERLLAPGNQVLVVSKPSFECIKQICNNFESYKDQILFRFTIGSVSDEVLKFWEPNAPSFNERLKSLKHAFIKGFQTSISCEPMLDNRIDKVIKKVDPFVTETIWLGKANRLLGKTGKGRLEFNGVLTEETKRKAEELNEWQNDENILKLYDQLKDNPKIRWKESIRNIIKQEGKS
ncbi:MAG: radical SAM protein [Melioribacteraceae bacterium]